MGRCPNKNVRYVPLALGLGTKQKLKGPRDIAGESLKAVRKILYRGGKFSNTDTCGPMESRKDI